MATDLSPIDPNAQQYAPLFDYLNAQIEAMMTGFVAEVTGQPADTLKLNRTTKRWETWNESAGQWEPAIDRYDIDVTRLNGRRAATAATANTIAERLSDGRLKAGVPTADDDVLRAFELAQHVLADNPHGMNALKVGLGNLSNKRQLERDQNLADIPDKEAARGPSGLNLGTAALLNTGTQQGRIPKWEDLPTVPNATTATSGRARFGTVAEHQNGTAGVAATPAGVRQMGFLDDQNFYESGEIDVNQASTTYAGYCPGAFIVQVWARCKVAQYGYSVGTEVPLNIFLNSGSVNGAAAYVSGGYIYVIQSAGPLRIPEKEGVIANDMPGISSPNWRLFVVAIKR